MNFIESIIQEAVNPEFTATGDFSGAIDPDEHLFRSLGEAPKDINSYDYERSLRIVYWMWATHPLAKRLTEIGKDFVIGNTIQYKTENERILNLLHHFWYDSYNKLPLKQHKKVRELSLYGEQIYTVDVNKVNGHVRLGYIDPLNIKTVKTEADNIEIVKSITTKGYDGKKYNVIQENQDGKLEGDVFFFRINNVSNAKRGLPDLLHLLDWLDAFDKILINEADRTQFLNSYVWDILCKGMNEAQINKYMKSQPKPKPGISFYHNENIERTAITPDLKIGESTELLKFLLSFMLGGAGVPEHFFALAYQINRATAEEMDPPFYKAIENRQLEVKYIFKEIFDFVIQKAIEYRRQITDYDTGKGLGVLTENEDKNYEIVLPEPSTKDTKTIALSLKELTTALTVAKQSGWLSNQTACEIFAMVASELGIDINAEEELQAIAEEQNTEAENDVIKYGKNNGNGQYKDVIKQVVNRLGKENFDSNILNELELTD